jgi:hypothetical protein
VFVIYLLVLDSGGSTFAKKPIRLTLSNIRLRQTKLYFAARFRPDVGTREIRVLHNIDFAQFSIRRPDWFGSLGGWWRVRQRLLLELSPAIGRGIR